ncbi:MAG: hypothetical protein KUG62_09595 [Rhodobacteraceae bacterium]|nr:hypothetical protein [Paracoccaceae bacterium]
MPDIAHTIFDMILGMTPELCSDTYVFVTAADVDHGKKYPPKQSQHSKKTEGLSLLVPLASAQHQGQNADRFNQRLNCSP